MPDVPMFTVTPAKRPRRQALSETLTAVGQTIASALTPGAVRPRESETEVEQVYIPRHFQRFALFHCAFNIPTINISLLSRSAIYLFDLKEMGAISEQEYQEKKETLLKDL
jgi:hypothetical protein